MVASELKSVGFRSVELMFFIQEGMIMVTSKPKSIGLAI